MDRSDLPSLARADRSLESVTIGDHLGALAAAVYALQPDVEMLATRVRAALQAFELSFSDESAYDDFELAWVSTGAAALFDATIGLAEALSAAVERLDA